MTTPDPTPHDNEGHQISNDYPPFLPENETEVARLLIQHRQLSEYLGDILPRSLDLSSVNRVLDVACGVGSWALDMARKHPAMQIIGIDKSQYFIEQARTMALSNQLTNATFLKQDMRSLAGDNFAPE